MRILKSMPDGIMICLAASWIACGVAELVGAAQPAAAPSARGNGPSLDAAEVNEFLAKQEKSLDAAKKRLLQAIAKRDAAIRRSRAMDADSIRRARETIEADRRALAESGKLPRSDELIDATVACLVQYQGVAERIETFRQRLAERAVRVEDPADMARLTKLEARLSDVLLGRESFSQGSTWVGQRHSNKGAFQLRLTVDNLTGSSFRGELRQSGASRNLVRMAVEGRLNGNRIEFRNTEMLRGKNRGLAFQGYVLSDRIVASVAGIAVDGKPIRGWVSLWSTASRRAKRQS